MKIEFRCRSGKYEAYPSVHEELVGEELVYYIELNSLVEFINFVDHVGGNVSYRTHMARFGGGCIIVDDIDKMFED